MLSVIQKLLVAEWLWYIHKEIVSSDTIQFFRIIKFVYNSKFIVSFHLNVYKYILIKGRGMVTGNLEELSI